VKGRERTGGLLEPSLVNARKGGNRIGTSHLAVRGGESKKKGGEIISLPLGRAVHRIQEKRGRLLSERGRFGILLIQYCGRDEDVPKEKKKEEVKKCWTG